MSLIPVPRIRGLFQRKCPVFGGRGFEYEKKIAHSFKNILPKLTKQKNIYFISVILSFNKHSIPKNFSILTVSRKIHKQRGRI